jgi:hypothetical protein
MKQIFNLITSILAYWAPLAIGVLMIVAAFPLKNISLGISGAMVVGVASLFRLFLSAVEQNRGNSSPAER